LASTPAEGLKLRLSLSVQAHTASLKSGTAGRRGLRRIAGDHPIRGRRGSATQRPSRVADLGLSAVPPHLAKHASQRRNTASQRAPLHPGSPPSVRTRQRPSAAPMIRASIPRRISLQPAGLRPAQHPAREAGHHPAPARPDFRLTLEPAARPASTTGGDHGRGDVTACWRPAAACARTSCISRALRVGLPVRRTRGRRRRLDFGAPRLRPETGPSEDGTLLLRHSPRVYADRAATLRNGLTTARTTRTWTG
jgi:hypothetical protein